MVILGVLESSFDSEWGDPYFVQPKPKTNRVHFISDLIYLNKQIKRKPYTRPNINEILFKSNGVQHDMLIDLNMRYYNI